MKPKTKKRLHMAAPQCLSQATESAFAPSAADHVLHFGQRTELPGSVLHSFTLHLLQITETRLSRFFGICFPPNQGTFVLNKLLYILLAICKYCNNSFLAKLCFVGAICLRNWLGKLAKTTVSSCFNALPLCSVRLKNNKREEETEREEYWEKYLSRRIFFFRFSEWVS